MIGQKMFMVKTTHYLSAAFLLAVGLVGTAAPVILNPTADAYVTTGAGGALSGKNFGAAGALAISAGGLPGGEFQSVLKFDLGGVNSAFNSQFGAGQWTIDSVTLKLTSSPHDNPIFNNIAPGQFGVSLMQNSSWEEGLGTGGKPAAVGISFNSLQSTYVNAGADQFLGTFQFVGGSSGSNEYQLGLTPGLLGHIQSGSELSLRLFSADDELSYLFSSRSGNGASPPALTISAIPEPDVVSLGAAALALLLFSRFRKTGVVRI